METFYFYKGDIDSTPYDFDPTAKLDQIRSQLISKGFMTVSQSNDFRFINYQNKGLKYEDMVVGIGTEKFIPLNAVTGVNKQAYLTDVNKRKAVDLIGFSTDWWFDRYMSCQMRLNTIDAEAKTANNGKFQPFMLTNVKTANPSLPGVTMDNVVVCEQNSIVQFNISSWGSAGYGYQIKPVAGTPINSESLYITFTGCPSGGNYANTGLRRYFSKNESQNNSTIKVVATDTLNLGGKTLNYMKFSIKTWKVSDYESPAGTHHKCDLPLPVPTAKKTMARPMMRTAALLTEDVGTGTPYNKLVNSDEVVVPGGTVKPGTTVPSGQQSSQNIGTIYNVKDSQDPGSVIGEVIFYIFVFKSHADAVAVFGKMNDINPGVWED